MAIALLLLILAGAATCAPFSFKESSQLTAYNGGGPVHVLYSNNYLKDSDVSWKIVSFLGLGKPYRLCPSDPLKYPQQRWWFTPFDRSRDFIMLAYADGNKLYRLHPNTTIDQQGCLVIDKLTTDWYGIFLYGPDYQTRARWMFLQPKDYRRPVTPQVPVFTPVVANPSTFVKLCPPAEDMFLRARSVRWHLVEPGKPITEIAYRYDSSYLWLGYKYSQYSTENIFRWGVLAKFWTDGCLEIQLSPNRYIMLTTAADSAGTKDIRRYIWRGYTSQAEVPSTFPKLGVLGLMQNPNRFHDKGPLDYWYLSAGTHYSYFDKETPRIFSNQTWEKGQQVRLCTLSDRRYDRSQWLYVPWWASLNHYHAHVIATRLDLETVNSKSAYHEDLQASPGLQVSGDGRCLTISNMGDDIAGTYVHFFNKRYHPTSIITLPPTKDAKPPADSYRQTPVSLGQKNLWLCPTRSGQMTWTEIKITLRDPVDGVGQVIFHRYVDWKTTGGDFFMNGYMSFSTLTRYAKHPDKTACVVIHEINWETLGTYEIDFAHIEGHKWRETVELVLRDVVPVGGPGLPLTTTQAPTEPPSSTTPAPLPEDFPLDLSNIEQTEEKVKYIKDPQNGGRWVFVKDSQDTTSLKRSRRALCDGCKTMTWGQNTKYVYRDHPVTAQGINRRQNCSLTWVNPAGMPLATYQNNTVHFFPQRDQSWVSDNYAVSYDDGALSIRRFSKKEEGVWMGMRTCPNTKDSQVYLTRLLLVDTIEHLKGDIFAEFKFPSHIREADAVVITQNGRIPACLQEGRCEFLPETGDFEIHAFLSSEAGIWVFNYTRHGTEPYVKVYTLSPKTPEGCFTVEESATGDFNLNIKKDRFARPLKVLWFRQLDEMKTDVTPVAIAEGGSTKETLMNGTFPFFNGNLKILKPELCGLYWVFVYSPDNYKTPVEARLFRYPCSPTEWHSPYFCPGIKEFSEVGMIVESVYPGEKIINHTIFTMIKPPYQPTYKTLCYAHDGHTLWDQPSRANVSCFFDGNYKVNRRRECGHHLILAFNHLDWSTGEVVRNYISCNKPHRARRSLLSSENDTTEAPTTPSAETTPDALATTQPVTEDPDVENEGVLETDEEFVITFNFNFFPSNNTGQDLVKILEEFVNNSQPFPTPDSLNQEMPPLVVFPISNFNSSSTMIIVSSLLILCLFFGLWLVCKWKKQKRELKRARAGSLPSPPDYEAKAPIYNPVPTFELMK